MSTPNSYGFPGCCGINVWADFTNQGSPLTQDAIDRMSNRQNGLSLVALDHYQWNDKLIKQLIDLDFKILCQDFYNSNTGNQITLFGKVHHPDRKSKSSKWRKLKQLLWPKKGE